MNMVDIILGVFLIWLLYRGFCRGFVGSILYLVGVLGTYCVIRQYSYLLANLLHDSAGLGHNVAIVLSYVLTFVICMVAVNLIIRLINNLLDALHLNLINRILGALLAGFNGLLIITLLLIILSVSTGETSFSASGSSVHTNLVEQMQEKVDALIDEQVGDNETLRQTLKSMKPSEAMKKLEELMDNGTIKKKPSAFSRKVEELTHASVILGWADTFKQIIIRKSAELR